MALNEALLPEFDHEMANTRKTLERVPEDKFGWKPHEKSGTMGWLAGHIATIPHWGLAILQQDEFDIGSGQAPPPPASSKELLALFDKSVATGRAALAAVTDAEFSKPWTLRSGKQVIFTQPRIAVFRGMVVKHLVHHRGQLTVYLRLNNVPVPALYGPSADESGM